MLFWKRKKNIRKNRFVPKESKANISYTDEFKKVFIK